MRNLRDRVAERHGGSKLGKPAEDMHGLILLVQMASAAKISGAVQEKQNRIIMKKILIAMLLLNVAGVTFVRAAETASPNTLVWCGLDYSKVKMIGTLDFRNPDQIFPGMLTAWNGLFMTEMLPQLEKMAGSVRTDLQAVQQSNEKAKAAQIEHKDGSSDEMVKPTHITEADIAGMVTSYKLENSQGLGLVFIMDRLVKAQEMVCVHVVFFDVASRKVVRSERVCGKAGGIGFRNFWFRPVKDTVKQLPKMYQDAKAKR
jgi:hypothetical protein